MSQHCLAGLELASCNARGRNLENLLSIPSHGPFCKTRNFPTTCMDCQQKIFIVTCSCGSTVLFDHPGPPWPRHQCVRWGLGRWTGVGSVGVGGTPTASRVVTKQVRRKTRDIRSVRRGRATRSVDLQRGRRRILTALVHAVSADTELTRRVNAQLRSGVRPFGLDPRERYSEIRLMDSKVLGGETYTALIPDSLARGLRANANVTAKTEICRKSFRGIGCWIVTGISSS